MNNKQLYELAKLGISRQNFVKKLKRLLSFSLTMILLAIWIAVSVFGILISMLNKDKTQYIVREESNTPLSEDKIYSDFMKNEKIEYYGIDFTGLNSEFTEEMYLNDKKIIPNMTKTVESSKEKNYITSLKILDTNKSKNKFVLSSIENKFNTENIKLLIQGNGFTGDAKKQIIISERFLKFYNLENKNVIGKNFTYELSYFNTNNKYEFLDDDNDSQNEFNFNDYENKNYDIKIFKNYKIVGVFNDKLLKYNDSEFIVSTNNLDFETFPIITNYSKGILFTYKNADIQNYSDEITKKGLIFPFMYGNTYRNFNSSASAISNKPLLIKEVQGDNFWELRKFFKWYDEKNFIYTMFFDNNMVSFIIYFDQILFIFIFLLVYGGIIFLSSILNYYNILDYNVNSRKRNMSLNKAIGFKNSDIKKLYFMEIGLMFFKALLIAVIIGALIIGLICIIIFAILQNHSTGILLGKYIKISLAMLPVAIVGLAVIMGILTWLFAYFQSKKLCKENIINHE